jgi:hypothetical protein
MLGVSFYFGRASHMAFDEQANASPDRHRGCKKERLAGQ